jgi:hypothetical protein
MAENGANPKEAYLADLRAQIERLTALLRAVESEGEGLSLDPSATAAIGGRLAAELERGTS